MFIWEISDKASAKTYLGMLGLPITAVCRDKPETLREPELITLAKLRSLVEEIRIEMGINGG